jgi:hypothetical protein
MKYSVEMDSPALIYIPSFMKIASTIRKLIARDTQTHKLEGNRIRLLQENNPLMKEIIDLHNKGVICAHTLLLYRVFPGSIIILSSREYIKNGDC